MSKKSPKNVSPLSDPQWSELHGQASASEEYQRKFRDDSHCSWDEKESLLLGRNKDRVSNQTKSNVFDPRLSTIAIERMNRVMAQHATGRVRALDNPNDKLASLSLDLTLNRYIIPNADSQYDLLTKFKLQDLYSLVYGSYATLVDYRIDDDYIGPDMWLIPIRHLFPEANSTTIEDSNHAFIDTWVSKKWLKSRPSSTWKNIDKVLLTLSEGSSEKDGDQQSVLERENSVIKAKGDSGLVRLRTRYERDRWVTYAVDASGLLQNCIVRDIANPQKNNEIPIVVKHAFPLIDRFYGLGEFERGKTLQYSINSLWNLYLDGLKMKIFPPMIYNANGVVLSTLNYLPGAKWAETIPNSIRQFQTSGQSEQAFQSTYNTLLASILNQAGTTDTTISKDVDVTQGKTPQALQMMASREGARDAWDRFMMEKTVEKTFNLMIDLLTTKQEKPIDLTLFEGEIAKLRAAYPDQAEEVAEIFESGSVAKMKVSKEMYAKPNGEPGKYKFDIETGTTMKKDDAQEHAALTELLAMITKMPGMAEQAASGQIQMGNMTINVGELIKRHIITSGVQDSDKIITEVDMNTPQGQEQMAEQQMGAEADQRMEQLGQMIAQIQPQQGMPPQGMQGGMSMGGM